MVKQLSQNSLFIFAVSFLSLFSVGSLSSYAEEVNNEEQENEAIIDDSNSRNTFNLLDIRPKVPEALADNFINGNEPVGVPLGTNSPIRGGDLPDGEDFFTNDICGIFYSEQSFLASKKDLILELVQELSVLPQDIPVKFPLNNCINRGGILVNDSIPARPVSFTGELSRFESTDYLEPSGQAQLMRPIPLIESQTVEAIGYIGSSGQAVPFTIAFLASFLEKWSGSVPPTDFPEIIIVRDPLRDWTYLVPTKSNEINLEQEALYSIVNLNLRRSNYKLDEMNRLIN